MKIETMYELSPLQKGMLFHCLRAQHGDVYITQVLWQMQGELDVDALCRAWEYVIARHAILRSAFFWEGLDAPLQVVARRVKLPCTIHDWRDSPPAAQQQLMEAARLEDRARVSALTRAPLMRLTLARTGDTSHLLLWSRHHLLLDGWSQALVLREVFTLYEVYRWPESGISEEQVLGPVQPFARYIAWLHQQDLSALQPFFRHMLAGIHAPTALRETAGTASGTPGDLHCVLPADSTAALQQIARQHGLTLNTLVQGVWAALLARDAAQHDVVFGLTSAGRPADLPGVESMVGLFINTVPIRVAVRPDQPLLAWFGELQRLHTDLREYEHTPLYEIQGWSQVPRHRPLFESVLVFENYPMDLNQLDAHSSLQLAPIGSHVQNSLPLTLRVVPGDTLHLHILYDGCRIDAVLAERMVNLVMATLLALPDTIMATVGALLAVADAAERLHHQQFAQASRQVGAARLKAATRRTVREVTPAPALVSHCDATLE